MPIKRREFDKLDTQVKDLIKNGQQDKAVEIIKKNKELFQQGEILKEFDKRMSKLASARKEAMEDMRLTPEQRVKVLAIIDEQIKEMSAESDKLFKLLKGGN
jgi:hypothetical protein